MSITLPEQVKIAHAYQIAGWPSAWEYTEIPIKPGEDEVALALAVEWHHHYAGAAGNISWSYLWKKSHPEEFKGNSSVVNLPGNESDIIDTELASFTTSPSQMVKTEYRVFPYPVVLLRPLQLVSQSYVDGITHVYVSVWYVLEKITAEALARLMVKDHG